MTRKAFHSCTFIINPSRYPEYAKILKKILKRIEVPNLIESESREHFIDSVREFCTNPHAHLLVWGGDGTAHDAINVLTEEMLKNPEIREKKSVGFLRGGSGNGIQDSYEVPLGIRKQVEIYAESMENNFVVDVDLLKATHGGNAAYCQLVGFGLDAQLLNERATKVYKRGKQKGRVKKGFNVYLSCFLTTFFRKYEQIQKELDIRLYRGKYAFKGTRVNAELPFDYLERKTKSVEIEAGSRPYYGRLFKVCPDVVCNDGYLDLYIYNFENRLSILQNAYWLWCGRHDRINKKFAKDKKPLIERYEIEEVQICSREPFDYHIDGESATTDQKIDGEYTIDIKVLPRQLGFLVPAAFYRKFHPFEPL